MKINAVIVTYNRLELLKIALQKLCEQTYPVNHIIIIDNNSTDGTQEWLKSQENPLYKVTYLEKNIGGAGGFYYGIKAAYEDKCDYIWIMDDDTFATNTALEKLMDGFKILNTRNVGFLSSNVLFKDGSPCLMNISHTHYEWTEFIDNKIVRLTHSSFVSMIVPCSVVKDIGLPIKNFFIWGDDLEYSTRIAEKYEGYFCGESVVYHYMKENKGVDIFNTPKERIPRFFYFYRNCMASNRSRGFIKGLAVFFHSSILIMRILFTKTKNKWLKVFTILKGLFAGMFFRIKIDYVED